jgi:hypothetical protein
MKSLQNPGVVFPIGWKRNLLARTEEQRRLKAEKAARKERLIARQPKGEELRAAILGELEYKRHRELG